MNEHLTILCAQCGADVQHVRGLLERFPVKPLFDPPNLSWQQPADLALILRSTIALAASPLIGAWLPLVGCGNGRLDPTLVIPILERHLDDRFTLVTLRGA